MIIHKTVALAAAISFGSVGAAFAQTGGAPADAGPGSSAGSPRTGSSLTGSSRAIQGPANSNDPSSVAPAEQMPPDGASSVRTGNPGSPNGGPASTDQR
jgi:hypothetical protein